MVSGAFEVRPATVGGGDADDQASGASGQGRLRQWESGVLRRVGRRVVAVLLVAALAWGAVGAYSYITARQAGQRAVLNAYISLATDLRMRLTQASIAFGAIASDIAILESEALGSTIEYLYETTDAARLLRLLDTAITGESENFAAYTWQVAEASDAVRQVLGWDALGGRMNSRDVGPVDLEFAAMVSQQLERLGEAVTLGPESRGGSRPRIDFDRSRRDNAIAIAREIQDLCRVYREEASVEPGRWLPQVSGDEAISLAREGIKRYSEYSGLSSEQLDALLGEAAAEEYLDGWRGLHFWRVRFGPAARGWEQAQGLVDARSGALIGWLWPHGLWAGPVQPPTPQESDIRVSAGEAAEVAAAFLASLDEERQYVYVGAHFEASWVVVFAPRRGGMVNYADPVVVVVHGDSAAVKGCYQLTHSPDLPWAPAVSAQMAAEAGARKLASVLGRAEPPEVRVAPVLYRMEWGGVRTAWAVETNPPTDPRPDLKVFIDAATGRYLGLHGIGGRSGFNYSEYVSWGFHR